MNNVKERNINLLMDLYQLTMSQVYYDSKKYSDEVTFDMFFRKIPENGGYAIMAGVEQVIEYIQGLKFSKADIQELREIGKFSEDFLDYLSEFEFRASIYSVPEGTPIFPYEPIITVKGPLIDCQLIETMLLLTINHQSLIATKASRIVHSAQGRPVMEFGARRAQGYDGAIYGARATYIAGVAGTATTLMQKAYGIPAMGTMAHSFVQEFDDEFEAFKAYALTYPDSCVLLIDTYDILNSGLVNAIRVAKEVLIPMGKRLTGIRIDSGDMAYFTKEIRKRLDAEGLMDCKICVSNSLDEYTITSLFQQGACIDSFGVGERMITSKSEPVFGGVYKLSSVKEGGKYIPRIKISENVEKITNPGYKSVWRLFDKNTGKAIGDVITFADEVIDENEPYVLFDPVNTWKKKKVTNYKAVKLQVPIFENGKLVYNLPSLDEVRNYCKKQLDTLWDETKRLINPQTYYVDLSQELWNVKMNMIQNKTFKHE